MDIEKLKSTFRPVKEKKRRKGIPCRLRVGGKFVAVHNGKSVWGEIGHCKNAVRNHLDQVLGWERARIVKDSIMKELVGVGPGFVIEIVPLEDAAR